MSGSSSDRASREYPSTPMVGVAGVVFSDGDVLLIQRGREPLLAAWSLPGGVLEVGETTAEGVTREIFEETGVRVRPVAMIATLDRIVRDDAGLVRYHYVLIEWLCLPEADTRELVCGDDAVAAAWVSLSEIYSEAYSLAEPTLGVIEQALKLAETVER
ncbi:MAG: hydrolase, family [Edaphobacter sp.]|nr:hydrolase, family [Edaphobacter sp.]